MVTDHPTAVRGCTGPAASGSVRSASPCEPHITIVIPTRNEADNVQPLVDRLDAALTIPAEYLFVDDSDDATPDAVRDSAENSENAVLLLHRPPGDRQGGLGGAVLAGFAAAKAPRIVVMDGDMQHPPEVVPALFESDEAADADVAVASRYIDRGSVGKGLSGVYRRAVSRASGTLARALFPRRVGPVTDPMSGFFAVSTEAVRSSELRPHGYKILLEVLVRAPVGKVVEIPYTFQARLTGESKASIAEGLRFLWHLLVLRTSTLVRPSGRTSRFLGFGAVGLSGVLVNSLLLWVLADLFSVQYLGAAFISLQVSVLWNFALIDRLVMPLASKDSYFTRLERFVLVANVLAPLHIMLLYVAVSWMGFHYLEANVGAIAVVFLLRYVVSSRWIYGLNALDLRRAAHRATDIWRNSNKARITLAVLLTAVAFPATAEAAWTGLWEPSSAVPLLIPLVTAMALLASRLASTEAEPQIHDRQLDVLLAGGLLVAAGVLMLLAPARELPSFRLVATVAFLGAAAVMLLGTRTAVRARGALLLPLVALDAVTPTWLEEAAVTVTHNAASLGAQLVGGTRPDLEWVSGAGISLAGAALCAGIAALTCYRVSWTGFRHMVAGVVLVTAVAVVVVLCSELVTGVGAVEAGGGTRLVDDVLLAPTVALLAWRWSRRVSKPIAVHQHLPRGRYAIVGLMVAALVFGLFGATAAASAHSLLTSPTVERTGASR